MWKFSGIQLTNSSNNFKGTTILKNHISDFQGFVSVGGVAAMFKINAEWGRLDLFEWVTEIVCETLQVVASFANKGSEY